MKKRFTKILLLCLSFLVLGFGCKGLSEEEIAAFQPVVLNYWTVYNDLDMLRGFAAEYKKIRPYVTINIRQVRYDEFDRLFTNALADDVAPDLVSMHNRWVRANSHRLSPMPESVEVSRLVVKSEFSKEIEVLPEITQMPSIQSMKSAYVKTVVEDAVVGGQVYGLPIAMDTMAIYYNKGLLDKAGIPEPPADWDEFVEAVKKTTRFDSTGRIMQSGVALGTGKNIDNSFDILSLLMMQSGVKMASGGRVTFADGLKKARSSHPTFQALRFYSDFATPTKEAYSWNNDQENALDAFVRGKTAFYLGFAFDQRRIRSRAPGIDLEVIPMFQLNQASPVNISNYWLESVVRRSKNQNEAWDFIRYITALSSVQVYTDRTLQPTPYRSQIERQMENPELEPFTSQVLFAENWFNGRNFSSAKEAISNMIDTYLEPYSQDKDPLMRDKEIINNAASRVQQAM